MSSSFAIVRDGRYSKFQSTEAAHRRFQYSSTVNVDSKQKKFSYFDVTVVKHRKIINPKMNDRQPIGKEVPHLQEGIRT